MGRLLYPTIFIDNKTNFRHGTKIADGRSGSFTGVNKILNIMKKTLQVKTAIIKRAIIRLFLQGEILHGMENRCECRRD
jgi:hypothetical protein